MQAHKTLRKLQGLMAAKHMKTESFVIRSTRSRIRSDMDRLENPQNFEDKNEKIDQKGVDTST